MLKLGAPIFLMLALTACGGVEANDNPAETDDAIIIYGSESAIIFWNQAASCTVASRTFVPSGIRVAASTCNEVVVSRDVLGDAVALKESVESRRMSAGEIAGIDVDGSGAQSCKTTCTRTLDTCTISCW